jgi:hypothetical protein
MKNRGKYKTVLLTFINRVQLFQKKIREVRHGHRGRQKKGDPDGNLVPL